MKTTKEKTGVTDIASSDWLGMDTAPLNGTLILGYDREGDYWLMKYSKIDHVWMEEDLLVYPLGWQPLPEIPNDKGEGCGD